MELTFDRVLAIFGLVLAIVLVVLDKAGKLKGLALLVLLGVAALMTIPLALGNSWVKDIPWSMLKFSRTMLMLSVVVICYSALALWVSSPTDVGETSNEKTSDSAPKLTIKASSFAGEYGPKVTTIAGVAWKPIYTDVRVIIENDSDDDYQNVDLFISSDLMTIYPAQITRLPGVTLIPEPTPMKLPPTLVIGQDAQGKDVTIPTVPLTADAGILAKRYRLLCNNLPHGAKMELLLPSIATNKFGGDPNKYFAPKRDAKEVKVVGQFLLAGKKRTVDQTVVPTPGFMPLDSKPPKTQAGYQSMDEEHWKIIKALVEKFQASHNGKLPTTDWINKRLTKEGRNFQMTGTVILVPQQQSGTKIELEDSYLGGGKIGILNNDPNASIKLKHSGINASETNIVNSPTEQGKPPEKP
jgi:hypothetical protein